VVLFSCVLLFSGISEAIANNATRHKDIRMEVANLFWKSKFTDLEQRLNSYRENNSRTSDGLWMSHIYYNSLAGLVSPKFADKKSWDSVFQKADEWIKQYPDAPSAYIVKANFLHLYAWKFRGEEPDAKPSSAYIENLQKAIEYLQSTKKTSSGDPEWYARMILMLKDLDVAEGIIQKQLDEASKRYPEYGPIYLNAMEYFLPKWQGDLSKIEAFANAVAQLTHKSEGMGMFARFYWTVSQLVNDQGALFQSLEIDWSKIRQGMEDIVSQYPDQWNINNFAFFACIAHDRNMTKELIKQVKSPISDVWKGAYPDCKQFSEMDDEMSLRGDIRLEVVRLFWRKDFKKLDEIADTYRKKKSRTPSGVWKLSVFYGGIVAVVDSQPDSAENWSRAFQTADEWVKLYPNSPVAHIVKATFLTNYAGKMRGGGWAKDVSPKAWELFNQYNQQARDYLLATKEISSQDPQWYDLMLLVERGLGVELPAFQKTLQEGIKKYPDFYEIYFSASIYLLPRWHGSKSQIEDFVNAAVENSRRTEGMGMYARIYWYVASMTNPSGLFKDFNADWKKMKQGINDVLAKYPDQWNINNFAFFACMAQDQDMTKKLLQKLEVPYPSVWGGDLFEACQQFASQAK
jgi:hypothetical protein